MILDGTQRFYRAGSQPGSAIKSTATAADRIEGIDSHYIVPPRDYARLSRRETWRAVAWTAVVAVFVALFVLSVYSHAEQVERDLPVLVGR